MQTILLAFKSINGGLMSDCIFFKNIPQIIIDTKKTIRYSYRL